MNGYAGSIEHQTLLNSNFRQVLFTGEHEQLVMMCLNPGEEIGNEVHDGTDQFFRIEKGRAKFVVKGSEEYFANGGDAVIVPAGKYHNVINTSKTKVLKLYTIYSPPNHPDGTVQATKADAKRAEAQ